MFEVVFLFSWIYRSKSTSCIHTHVLYNHHIYLFNSSNKIAKVKVSVIQVNWWTPSWCCNKLDFYLKLLNCMGYGYGVERHFQHYFSCIVAVWIVSREGYINLLIRVYVYQWCHCSVSDCCCLTPNEQFSAILCREQVNF